MHPKGFHRSRPVATQGTGFDQVVLAHVFVLEMCPHRYLSLETSITDRAMVGQCFGVRCKMLREMILAEKSFLTDATLVRFDASVTHLMSTHISAI